MFLVAFPAIYRSVTGWYKRYFSFLFAVSACCFMHLAWTAWSETASAAAASASETAAASSIVAHIHISLCLFCWFRLIANNTIQ